MLSPDSSSPVFVDDDSRDSGYGSSQSKFDSCEQECKRRCPFNRQTAMTSLKVWCEEREDEEVMEVDDNHHLIEDCDSLTDQNSPFASLRNWREKPNNKLERFKLKDSTNLFQGNPKSFTSLKVPNAHFVRCRSESEVGELAILQAIQKAEENRNLIGDFTDGHALPLLKNPKVPDLKCISAQTVCDILDNKFDRKIDQFLLIDCRYPYEYVGGHIKSAVNIYTPDQLRIFLDANQSMKCCQNSTAKSSTVVKRRTVFLFYCEFSKERGPRMCRHLRTSDRQHNQYRYPYLDYPELYLIEGGYKNFFSHFQHHCEPRSYKPMDHVEHAEDLRKFRVKSKSWSSFALASSSSASSSDTASAASADTPQKAPLVRRGLFKQLENL